MIPDWPCHYCGEPYEAHKAGAHDLSRECQGKRLGFAPVVPERAISLHAPWVDAILRLGKDIENRALNFPRQTGWFWLHASLFGKSPEQMNREVAAMVMTAAAA